MNFRLELSEDQIRLAFENGYDVAVFDDNELSDEILNNQAVRKLKNY